MEDQVTDPKLWAIFALDGEELVESPTIEEAMHVGSRLLCACERERYITEIEENNKEEEEEGKENPEWPIVIEGDVHAIKTIPSSTETWECNTNYIDTTGVYHFLKDTTYEFVVNGESPWTVLIHEYTTQRSLGFHEKIDWSKVEYETDLYVYKNGEIKDILIEDVASISILDDDGKVLEVITSDRATGSTIAAELRKHNLVPMVMGNFSIQEAP